MRRHGFGVDLQHRGPGKAKQPLDTTTCFAYKRVANFLSSDAY